jgi:rhodanese-related sulfurtransferase
MPSLSSPSFVRDLAPQVFVRMPQPPVLIDVRSGPEYASGHAPTALNLSLDRLLLGQIPLLRRWILPQWFQHLPKDHPVAVVCLTAHRSPIAAQILLKMGFGQVLNVGGGMLNWQKQKLPIQRGWQRN